MQVFLGVAATLVLGTWGWLDHHYPFDESLYRALALFEINNDSYAHGEGLADWHFRLGRWTGAMAVITSLLAAAALLHEHLASALAQGTLSLDAVAPLAEVAQPDTDADLAGAAVHWTVKQIKATNRTKARPAETAVRPAATPVQGTTTPVRGAAATV